MIRNIRNITSFMQRNNKRLLPKIGKTTRAQKDLLNKYTKGLTMTELQFFKNYL